MCVFINVYRQKSHGVQPYPKMNCFIIPPASRVSGGLEVVSSQHTCHLPYSSFRASIRQDIKNAE